MADLTARTDDSGTGGTGWDGQQTVPASQWDGTGRHPLGGVPPSQRPSVSTPLIFASEDEAFWFEERAAIREFDGGVSRDAAERLAWFDLTQMRRAMTLHRLSKA